MHKYLFITYGEPGWRGVQIRALRMAKYLPKEEVLFWNSDNSEIIKEWGFDVETIDSGLINPESINFPDNIEMIIFSDLPSNKLYNYSIYQAALSKNIKIVICEQLYRKEQMQEYVYKKFAENSDLFLLNSISCFKSIEKNNIKIVPPQLEFNFSKNTKADMYMKYGIPENKLLLFGIGYHENVYEKIKEVTKKLSSNNNDFYTIASSPLAKSIQRDGQLITIPFDVGDDFFQLIYSADLLMVKFGFLQILEALALHKPTIVLGEAGLVLKDPNMLDEIYKKALRFDLEITEKTIDFVNKFISDATFRTTRIDEIKKLHNGELWGAKRAIEEIIKIETKPKTTNNQSEKKVAILINNEIFEKREWLNKQENIYPLHFIIPAENETSNKERIPDEIQDKKIKLLMKENSSEILTHSFSQLFIFSNRKYDGFTDIFPWYQEWVRQLESIFRSAKTIYISKYGKKLFEPLIKANSANNKINELT